MTWMGFRRPDGSFGARNQVLIIHGGFVAASICQAVRGTVTINTAEVGYGRTSRDRETGGRFLVNLAENPNVAAVIVHGDAGASSYSSSGAYSELAIERITDEIAATGKPVVLLDSRAGTFDLLAKGIEVAREMVWRASRIRREPAEDAALWIGTKCGSSDATSGLAGNGVVGYVYDKLVAAGGVAVFGENTEIIGAEHILARRAATQKVAEEILASAKRMEDRALACGEDIRTINPIPSNYAGGISSLEEKSLGAIHKTGTQPIQSALQWGERPGQPGLHYVDTNAFPPYIFPGFAASGCQVVMFQLGGAIVPEGRLLQTWPGVVSPLLWLTGNRDTACRAANSIDFSSASVLDGSETMEEAGERLYQLILDVASGSMTHVETMYHADPFAVYFQDPIF